jgi:hypothetical protein
MNHLTYLYIYSFLLIPEPLKNSTDYNTRS